jgi:hypothetical protein
MDHVTCPYGGIRGVGDIKESRLLMEAKLLQ